jgi:HK97 gp10 family phage protein
VAVEVDDQAFILSLEKALKALVARSRRNVDALGDLELSAAENLAPVKTGHLRRSFKKRVSQEAGGLSVEISNDAPYAAFVEFGTSDTPAQPYMRPAMDRARAAAPSILKRT